MSAAWKISTPDGGERSRRYLLGGNPKNTPTDLISVAVTLLLLRYGGTNARDIKNDTTFKST